MALQYFKTFASKFKQNSEALKYFSEAKSIYKEQRANGKSFVSSLSSSAIATGKNAGYINSILAGIGAAGGTVAIPIPGGAVVGAELMLRSGKTILQCSRHLINFFT